jgi:hypothetical protein
MRSRIAAAGTLKPRVLQVARKRSGYIAEGFDAAERAQSAE